MMNNVYVLSDEELAKLGIGIIDLQGGKVVKMGKTGNYSVHFLA